MDTYQIIREVLLEQEPDSLTLRDVCYSGNDYMKENNILNVRSKKPHMKYKTYSTSLYILHQLGLINRIKVPSNRDFFPWENPDTDTTDVWGYVLNMDKVDSPDWGNVFNLYRERSMDDY